MCRGDTGTRKITGRGRKKKKEERTTGHTICSVPGDQPLLDLQGPLMAAELTI